MSVVSLGSNISSLKAQRQLGQSSQSLATSLERLSSGARINRASDDAAGLSIASGLNKDSRVFSQALRNVNDGVGLLNIAQGALTELSNITTRLNELAEQSANGVYSVSQRRSIDKEGEALVAEFNRIVEATEFNKKKIIDGSMGELRIQAGYGLDGSIAFELAGELGRNVGTGNFQNMGTFSAGSSNFVMELADVSGDGNLDIVAISDSTAIKVLTGNGDGTFNAEVTYSVPDLTSSRFAMHDFNGDSVLDIAVSAYSTLKIAFGNSNGSFQAAVTVASGGPFGGVMAGDFNGDGIIDLHAETGAGGFVVLTGNSNGTFNAGIATSWSGGSGRTLALGDFNGDGNLDILGQENSSDNIVLMQGNGNGTFSRKSLGIFSDSIGYESVASGDFNLDGNLDFALSAYSSQTVQLFSGKGDGTFAAPLSIDISTSSSYLKAADLNGDGVLDLMNNDLNAAVQLGNGDGTFNAEIISGPILTYGSATLGDINGDGVLDFIAPDNSSANISVHIADTTSTTKIGRLYMLTQQGARESLEKVKVIQTRIANELGAIGSTQSRLSVATNNLMVSKENFEAAESRIKDADVASESAELIRVSILQQASAAVLSQANSQPELALRLLS